MEDKKGEEQVNKGLEGEITLLRQAYKDHIQTNGRTFLLNFHLHIVLEVLDGCFTAFDLECSETS